jgi:ribose transport system ATP-binding protein
MSDHVQQASGGQAPLLELHNVSKHFGGVMALKNVDFTLLPGEIHGLVGENGAGKSTTMKIIAGVHTDFEGTMKIKGREVRLRSAGDALANSIGMVHQELSVVPDLTVAENVFLGNQPLTAFGTVDWGRMNREAKRLIASLGARHRPHHHHGLAPRRACSSWSNCRACCFPARRSSFSTSRPPPSRRLK